MRRQQRRGAHQRARAAGVRDRDGRPAGQQRHQLVVNAQLQALHVHAVHQELVAAGRQLRQAGLAEREAAEALPAVGDNPVLPIPLAAAQVEDQPPPPHQLDLQRSARARTHQSARSWRVAGVPPPPPPLQQLLLLLLLPPHQLLQPLLL